ncbi:phage antirepressor KilAC domain-containing protein [Pseudomonas sp. NPDC087358]|uniref:phage antirepressor KilAC domain-containing protein n=1 Tax=Pseudomonas sp. NPDC087358 TaxID=3364439 RepID=UPI00384DCEDC
MSIVKFNGGDAVTMTSSEIAELTGKQHKDVIRDVRVMLAALKKDGADLRHVREDKDSRGYTENFHLERELTETLITGYSIPLRNKVIKRLHDLEQKLAAPHGDLAAALNDPAVLKGLLLENVGKVLTLTADNDELSSKKLMLEQKVAADQPKVEFHDHVVVSHGVHYVRDIAQSIGTGQNRLFEFLRQKRWVDRYNQPYQAKIEAGYLVASPNSYKDEETGERRTKFTCRVTGKGFAKIRELWARRDADLLEEGQ